MSSARDFLCKIPTSRRRKLFWVVGLFLAYVLIGFLVLPPIIKWQLVKQLPAATKRTAAVRQVMVNPLTLSLTIRDLSLTEPDGRTFAAFEEFYINFQSSSLFRWAWTFKEVRLVKPSAEVILLKNGELNLSNMFPADEQADSKPAAKPSGIPRINIYQLHLTNGFFAMEDQTRRTPFRTEYKPINFVLTAFSTRPDSETPYSFRAESDADRSLTWKGDFSVQPLKSVGELEVLGVRLNHYHPYLEDYTTAILTNGHVDLKLAYSFAAGTNGVDLVITNGSFALMDLDIRDPRTQESVTGLERFELRGAYLNLRERTANLGDMNVNNLSLLSRIQQDGHLNFLDLMVAGSQTNGQINTATNAAPTGTNSPVSPAPWTIALNNLAVTNASLAFEDLANTMPFKTLVKPFSAELKNLSTASGTEGSYHFSLVTEADEKLSGEGKLSVTPLASQGKITLTDLTLKKYMPYAQDFLSGTLKGNLGLELPYSVAIMTNGITGGVSNMVVSLANLRAALADSEEDVVSLNRVDVQGVSASLQNHEARVGLINASGGSVLARQFKDGTINLLGLLKSSPTASNAAPANSTSPVTQVLGGTTEPTTKTDTNGQTWAVVLEELNVEGYRIQVEDQKPARPVVFVLSQTALNVKGASTDTSAPVTAKLRFVLGDQSIVDLAAKATGTPLSAEVTLGVTNIDLRSFQPYMDELIALKIDSGLFSTWGVATHDPSGSRFSGDLRIANFGCTDTQVLKPFAVWKDLLISGVEAEYSEAASGRNLSIKDIKWTEPKATLVMSAEGTPNLPKMVAPDTEPGAPVAESQAQASSKTQTASSSSPDTSTPAGRSTTNEPFPVEIGAVTLEKASLGFSDLSIQPNAIFGIEQLNGTIKGLSSAMNTTAEVNLEGLVGERSPVAISGQVNPLASQLFVDLVISNANTQLTPLTGYMEKFVGHPLNKGRLTTSLHYVVKGNDIKAENKIQIDQLTLGPRNNSPDATRLPVKLGIALLKDANGVIDLDVPLSGKLDDPEFKLGPIILKVVVNTLVKAATSPFKLLGALVGGGEELSFVQFTPGTSQVAPDEIQKLEKLKNALAARPALNVDIEGQVDANADRQALALAKLKEQIRSAKIAELTKGGKTPESLESFKMDPEDEARVIRRMFAERFGTNTVAVLQSNAVAQAALQVKAVPTQAQKRPGLTGNIREGYGAVMSFLRLDSIGRSPAEKKLTREEREMLDSASPDAMEMLLADQTITVTAEEYRALMRARAEAVQSWLLNEGGVAPDRLLIVAPVVVGEGYSGRNQASFSLN